MTAAAKHQWIFWAVLFAAVLLLKLCINDILWAEEGYGSAAAVQILHGKMLYRDFWFDKPPLAALLYTLWLGVPGWGLRVAGAVYVLLCCAAAARFAAFAFGQLAARYAALLTAFFLLFDSPVSVTTLAPDLLLVLPAILAVDAAQRGQSLRSGLWCACGLAVNAKAMLLFPVCAWWCGWQLWQFGAGIVLGTVPWLTWLTCQGAIRDYYTQVWWFGGRYSKDTFVTNIWKEGLVRTANWCGFHAALLLGAVLAVRRSRTAPPWILWLGAGMAGAIAGYRFFPRYYFLLLPPLLLLAAEGLTKASRICRAAAIVLLAIPLVRFAPRYFLLGNDVVHGRPPQWADVRLNQDSREAAAILLKDGQPAATLLVWGYRPDIFAYARLPVAGRFLDSQMLTGVIADRHLSSSEPSFLKEGQANRKGLPATRPTWIVDGLGPLNPALSINEYPELREWLQQDYRLVARTAFCVIYRRKTPGEIPDTAVHRPQPE